MFCYLDNAATTKPSENVIKSVNDMLTEEFGNPSSLHKLGVNAERVIKEAKQSILKAIRAKDGDVIFTSGGTESNNLAIIGSAEAMSKRGKHIITTSIEHKSVINSMGYLESLGFEVDYLNVDTNGQIDFDDFKGKIRPDTILVSIMHINNETGALQPIDKIGSYLSKLKNKPIFHIDAVQGFMKYPINVKTLGCDLISISGHKIHCPKGVGALYVSKGTRLKPLTYGGQQGNGIRPGTENTIGICAINRSVLDMKDSIKERYESVSELKIRFIDLITKNLKGVKVNGDISATSPYIVNMSFDSIRGEVLLHSLECDDIFVSTGSACNSKNKSYSHVLTAMKMTEDEMEGAIRFSFTSTTTAEEIDYATEKIIYHVNNLQSIIRGK